MVATRRYPPAVMVANAAAYLVWTGWVVAALARTLHREVWRP